MLFKKVVLLCILLFILTNIASAQYYYDSNYDFSLFSLYDIQDVLYIYELNSSWFDFFIFLIIFLGLTQTVFGESHFRNHSKTLSIGLSLALSIALVVWERNTGINLLNFGPLAFLIIVILMLYIIYSLLKKMFCESWIAGVWTYIIGFIVLILFGEKILQGLAYFNLPVYQIISLLDFLFWVALLIGIYGLAKKPASPSTTPRP